MSIARSNELKSARRLTPGCQIPGKAVVRKGVRNAQTREEIRLLKIEPVKPAFVGFNEGAVGGISHK
jgi:hypothetical protein